MRVCLVVDIVGTILAGEPPCLPATDRHSISANAGLDWATRGHEIAVDETIAIVVEAIADFVGGPPHDRAACRSSALDLTHHDAVAFAFSHAGHAFVAHAVHVVHRAIAIVVHAIARLFIGKNLVDAGPILTVLAALLTGPTWAHFDAALGALVADMTEQTADAVFVDVAVAIVVESVADLYIGRPGNDVAGESGSGSIAVHQARPGTLTFAYDAGGADDRHFFVHFAVAIVVESVAGFCGRKNLAVALDVFAIDTNLDTGHADPDPDGFVGSVVADAHERIARVVLVSLPITIVVHTVADLFSCDIEGLAHRRGALGAGRKDDGASA